MAMSRLSWSAPFANLWSSSPSPGPGAGPPSTSSRSSTASSIQISQNPSAAPFPSIVARSSASSNHSAHTRQSRQRLQSHYIPPVAVPPRIEENVADAISSSYTPANTIPGSFPVNDNESANVAETVAVLTSTRKRHNATPRIVEAENALARAAAASERRKDALPEPKRSATHPVPFENITSSTVERRPMSPTPPMEVGASPRNGYAQAQAQPQPAATTTNGHLPQPYSEREARYKRERDEYRRRCAELDRGLSDLQDNLSSLQVSNRRLEQALDTEARSKTDLIDDLARKRSYCESIGSARADSERKLLEMKLVEKKLRAEIDREREISRKVLLEKDLAKREAEEMKMELDKLRAKERTRDRDRRRDWERDEEDYEDELKAARDELARAEKQHEVTRRLLEEKADELKGVQLFASRVDEVSIADVVGLVNSLNAEILQGAAFIADSLQFSSSPDEQVPEQDLNKATKAVMTGLGRDMAKAVWSSRPGRRKEEQEFDPTVVQYALQVAMTGFCERVINDWAPNSEANAWLESIYGTIQSKESQAVAGRWRALTRAQLGGAKDPNFIIKHLADRLVNILILVGCSKSQVQVDNFRENFNDHLSAIANYTVRVQTAAGESITSVDMRTYSCSPGEVFTLEYMEDMYSDGGSRNVGKAIAGTTELGLLKKDRKVAGQPESTFMPLVKAKVVLAAVLRE